MGHGMFRQCIISETCQREAAVKTAACHLLEDPAKADVLMNPGALVLVEGLVKLPAFNGRSAVVQSFDETTGRYDILLASSEGSQQAKVRGENLRLILPCP